MKTCVGEKLGDIKHANKHHPQLSAKKITISNNFGQSLGQAKPKIRARNLPALLLMQAIVHPSLISHARSDTIVLHVSERRKNLVKPDDGVKRNGNPIFDRDEGENGEPA